MDPRDIFMNSDSVRLTQVALDLNIPSGLPGGGTRQRMNVCLTKRAGELDLTLNTMTDLGLPFSQNIRLEAQLPLSTGQPPRVTWNINEQGLNLQLSPTVTLDGIKGSVTASFQEIAPQSPGLACDNTPRAVGVSFQTVGTQNRVDLFVTGLAGSFTAENIQLTGGTGSEPLNIDKFDVSVRPRRSADGCQPWARQGQAVWFDGIVTNLPSDAEVDFAWLVPGTPGGGTGPSVLVDLPNATTDVTVAVTVTATKVGQKSSKSDSLTFPVLSHADADSLHAACLLRRWVKSYSLVNILVKGSRNEVPGLVDPIWDEVPFFRSDGIALSQESLQDLFAAAEGLRIQSASVAMTLKTSLAREETAALQDRVLQGDV